jgi:hypothetical protein
MRPVENVINPGDRFGRLIVIEQGPWQERKNQDKQSGKARVRSFWVQCDCGSPRKLVLGVNLRKKGSTTLSCGCLRSQYTSMRLGKPETAIKTLFGMYQRRARENELEWGLSYDQFKSLTSSPCFYTGAAPSQEHKISVHTYIYNGIDRLDSSRGYTPENCVPCHKDVNFMKRELSYDEFLNKIKAILKYREEQDYGRCR